MKRLFLTIATIMFFSTINPGFAQDELELTLEGCVDLAFKKNPELQMAEKQVAKAKASVWESYSTILPQVQASASFQRAWEIQQTTIPNFIKLMMPPDLGNLIPELQGMPDYVQIAFGLENTYTYGASLTQPLFLGGAGVAGVKIARSAYRASQKELEAQRQDLILQTTNAFYACLVASEIVTVQQEALSQAEENFATVEKKYNVGSASGFDKMRAEVEVANLKPQVITAKNNYNSALTGLRTVLGLDRDTLIKIQGSLTFANDDLSSISLADLQKMALIKRPVVQALDEQKNISKKSITVAKSQFLPKLFFTTDYSYLAMKGDDPLSKLSQDDFSKGFTSAISLQIPLFTGFKNTKQYQKAKIDYNIMMDTERQMQNNIAAEVEIAYNKFKETLEKYESANQSVALAKEALRLANLMYEEGANTQLDVMGSRLALTQAQLNFISSLYEYQMARYQLRRVTGTLKGIL